MLAASAELFYLISSLLLPHSESFFRASGMPLEIPQAVGESLLCLLWDAVCLSASKLVPSSWQKVAGTPCRYLTGWWRVWELLPSPLCSGLPGVVAPLQWPQSALLHGLSGGTGRAFIQTQ